MLLKSGMRLPGGVQSRRIADCGYVIVHGQIAFESRSFAELNNNDLIREFYLAL